MMTKPLLLLAALTLAVHASHHQGCLCIRTIPTPVPRWIIKKIEIHPISGRCRQIEVVVTRKNNSKVCVDPKQKLINAMLSNIQRKNMKSNSTTVSPTASTIIF